MKIERGMYVKTSEIKDTEQWKQVIDAFVGAGFHEYEGYTDDAWDTYVVRWQDSLYVGVDDDGDIIHFNRVGSYGRASRQISVDDLLGIIKPTPHSYTELDCRYFLDDTMKLECRPKDYWEPDIKPRDGWRWMPMNDRHFHKDYEYREVKPQEPDNTQEISKLKEELKTIAARLKELGE